MKRTTAIAGSVATGLLLGACSLDPGASSPVERPAPDSAHVTDLALGLNDAGYRMFLAAAAESDDDVVLSPLSIGLAFGMLDVGATDNLAVVLEDLFGYPVEGEDRWSAFNTLEQTLVREGSEGTEVVEGEGREADTPTLRLANRAFVDSDAELEAGYLELVQRWFGADAETLALQDDREGSRVHINAWVAEQTNQLIPELLADGAINKDAALLLINALYLKAAWQTPFDDINTEDADFTLVDGTTTTVPLMRQGWWFGKAYAGDGYSAIELPYAQSELSMLVIAPDAGNYAAIEARLGSDFVSEIDALLAEEIVEFSMPRFTSTSDINLRALLEENLGIDGLFGVTQLQGIAPDVEVSAAVHAAKVIVDEEGTEAAAATAIELIATGAPADPELTIRIDDPFLYVIRDHETGAVLFVGRVLDPSAS